MGVLQLFPSFYESIGARTTPMNGDIYWVPVPSVEAAPRVLEVNRSDPRTHDVIDYTICQIQKHHFTKRQDRLPIKMLTLGATEELLIAKAKRRPAVILYSCGIEDVSSLPKLEQRLAKGAAVRTFVVCPLYSTATMLNPGTFMPSVVARIRTLRYPHLACMPELGTKKNEPAEIVRLDRLYLTHLQRGCSCAGWRVNDEILQLLRDQFLWTAHGTVSEYLGMVIETVCDSMPEPV